MSSKPVTGPVLADITNFAGLLVGTTTDDKHTATITLDGSKASIQAGGGQAGLAGAAGQAGTISLLNPAGKLVVELAGTDQAHLRLYRVGGQVTVEFQCDPAGLLELSNGQATKTIRLHGEGGAGGFGAPGVDGDVLVFAATAKSTQPSDAAIWIKGSTGDIILQNADCAEEFEVQDGASIEPGVVLALDDQGTLALSNRAYDRKVAGIVSGAGGLRPGIVLGRSAGARNRWPIALSGKAFCKVDAQYSPVAVGDLLTTSSTLGHAMAARDHERAFGAVIGKALAPLCCGQGLIPVLIALQ